MNSMHQALAGYMERAAENSGQREWTYIPFLMVMCAIHVQNLKRQAN